jgi:hypothetical protein
MMTDAYEDLGPILKARLDSAEMNMARVRDWIAILADRGPQHNLIARELCLLLGLAAPRPWTDR